MTDWRKKSEPVEGVETYFIARDGEPYIPESSDQDIRDGKIYYKYEAGKPVIGAHDQCTRALMRLQGMSPDWAMQHEGWAVLPYEKNEPAEG